METVVLYRPVGPLELELIETEGWRAFPPRLPDQPIFYPVTNLEYATQIVRELQFDYYAGGLVGESPTNG